MTPLPRRLHGHRCYGPATARKTPLPRRFHRPAPVAPLPRERHRHRSLKRPSSKEVNKVHQPRRPHNLPEDIFPSLLFLCPSKRSVFRKQLLVKITATSETSLCAIALMENKMPPFTLDSIPNLVMPHTVVRLYVETRVPRIPMPFDLASADETNEAKRLFIDCTGRALPFEEVHGGQRQGHNR